MYVVSAGDLGATASSIDKELTRVFKITAIWNAVVVIDEADVFLEQRSLHDLERNAMVAVFLRHLEYVMSLWSIQFQQQIYGNAGTSVVFSFSQPIV